MKNQPIWLWEAVMWTDSVTERTDLPGIFSNVDGYRVFDGTLVINVDRFLVHPMRPTKNPSNMDRYRVF